MRRLALLLFMLAACNRRETATQTQTPGAPPPPAGNAAHGKQLVAQYGCNVCHVIPDVAGPQGSLGPPLAGVAARPSISHGRVPNNPANLARFIENPAALNPGSSMPPLGISTADAQDIAAYLLTLK
ncbi:MAG TPA: c-type cytochrome [Thermoanaerobaculia bacterium]|jgi:cytochrome c2